MMLLRTGVIFKNNRLGMLYELLVGLKKRTDSMHLMQKHFRLILGILQFTCFLGFSHYARRALLVLIFSMIARLQIVLHVYRMLIGFCCFSKKQSLLFEEAVLSSITGLMIS